MTKKARIAVFNGRWKKTPKLLDAKTVADAVRIAIALRVVDWQPLANSG